jgi:gliding motility-associated-like protein
MRTTCLLLLAIVLSSNLFSQTCPPNLDFELGNYSHWKFFTGSVKTLNGDNAITLESSEPIKGRHELISSANAGIDPFGKFPTLCPYGGNYSIKLGNQQSGAEAEGLSYTFIVPSEVDTFTFTFFYAVVFEDPKHPHIEQPRFFATAYDVLSGQLINCASYDFVATGSIPGFEVSSVAPDVLFKNWSPVSIQFAGLANREVRLEFKTADCTQGGHFGYAYVDVGTGCSNILATAPYCVETNSVILNAPYGFKNYTWYNSDYSVVIGNQQSLTLSPPPAVNEQFFVDMEPYPGFGCRDTTYAFVNPMPTPGKPAGKDSFFFCQSDPRSPLVAIPDPGHEVLWYSSETGGLPSTIAPLPSTSVKDTFYYYVSQKALFGCESLRRRVTVIINPTPFTSFNINNNRQCLEVNEFEFKSTSTNLANSSYAWDFGDGQTSASSGPNAMHNYTAAGNYRVSLKVTNPPGCSNERNLSITVSPRPVAAFSFPSAICEQQTVVRLNDQSSVPQGLSTIRNWWWDVNGAESFLQKPPDFIPAGPGSIPVKLAVTSQDGCFSDTTTQLLTIHHRPVAAFQYSLPLCDNKALRFNNISSINGAPASEVITRWNWDFGNGNTSAVMHPLHLFNASVHQVQLVAETNFGCRSLVADSQLIVHPKPFVSVQMNDSCIRVPVSHQALEATNSVSTWYWDFGRGLSPAPSRFRKIYYDAGDYPFTVIGETQQGCTDTVYRPFRIFDNKAFAGRDTVAAMNEPVQLNAKGGSSVTYNWTPSIGLNDPTLENPVATYDRDMLYNLYAVSDKGCVSTSKILIKRYIGPSLLMPSAFTPNNDGLNDTFKVLPVGIKTFTFLSIFNRHGQLLFHTKDASKGWDGNFQGAPQKSDTYVVLTEAIDYRGNHIREKKTLVLIR